MFNTRSAASILPCGNKAYWDTLAEHKYCREFYMTLHRLRNPYKLLHQKLYQHRLIGIAFASVGFPEVLIETKPPACWILSNALLSTTKSLITGNAFALKAQ
jgi:hypothetical protein